MTKQTLSLSLLLVLTLTSCSSVAIEFAPSSQPPGSVAPASPAPSSSGPGSVLAPSSAPATSTPPSSASSASPAGTPATVPPAATNDALPQADQMAVRAIQLVSPAIVKITHPVAGGGQALGSGSIIDPRGYILTNSHVAEGATTYQVTLSNNKTVPGRLIGLDPLDDLAVIQISEPDLPTVEMGDSSKLQVGQTVLAIGNPIGFTRTVTSGIVSALDRTIPEPPSQVTGQATTIPNMIQTSAPINPGNSGGALIDLNGRLIGVPTLAAGDPEFGGVPAQGIAFAVPVNRAKVIIPQLIQNGRIINSGRAFLGVSTSTVDQRLARAYRLNATTGAYIAQIVPNGAAARAGLQIGDIIQKFDDKDITSSPDLGDAILQKKPGDQSRITYASGSGQKTATVTLQEAPASQA